MIDSSGAAGNRGHPGPQALPPDDFLPAFPAAPARDRAFRVRCPAEWRLLGFALLAALPAQAAVEARHVLYFGDSITAGSELPADRRLIDRWPAQVMALSQGRLVEWNEGLGGRPTDAEADFAAALARHPAPDALVLALGTNDSRDLSADMAPKAVAHLRRMIAAARAAHPAIKILLAGPPNIALEHLGPTKPIGPQRAANLRALNAAFARLARESHCRFVSFYGVVPPASLAKDGVHPDAAGNRALAAVALQAIEALFAPPVRAQVAVAHADRLGDLRAHRALPRLHEPGNPPGFGAATPFGPRGAPPVPA